MDDWQLLQEFAAHQNETAFETLVGRHAALVHSVALRHVGEPHLAEDVAQSVFILLARKAGSLRRGTVLSGWLFQSTRFVAQRALRHEQRRQRREKEALAMQEQLTPDAAWQRIAPLVDEALGQLNHADRDALLLRYFEGRSLREVGERTGATEDAAKKRVSRALDKVRDILTKRGFTLSATALGACMARQSQAALPAQMVEKFSQGALSSSAAQSLAGRLAEEVLAAWRQATLKTAAGITASVLLIGLFLLWLPHRGVPPQSRADSSPVETTAADAGIPPRETTVNPAVSPVPETKILRFRAVDAATGAGIPRVRVAYTVWTKSWQLEDHLDAATDAAGECIIPYPPDAGRLDVGVVQDGFAARFATWPSEGSSEIPAQYTLRLDRVTNSLGGQILDSQGQPLANATVWFQAGGTGDSAHRERPRERFGFLQALPASATDGMGHWSLRFIPPRHAGFSLEARHPDFADTRMVSSAAQQAIEDVDEQPLQMVWSGKLVTRMEPAFTLTGQFLDEGGNPIPGGRIQEREQSTVYSADDSGMFVVPKLSARSQPFTFSAEGYSPERRRVEIGPNMQPLVVTLQRGAVLRLLLLDGQGFAVPGARVILDQWGEHRGALEWHALTDQDGRIEWASAPRDAVLELCAYKDGFGYTRGIRLTADAEEHVIQMGHALTVNGRVVDAESGDGIRDFKAVPGYGGYGNRDERWFAGSTVRGTNGVFKLKFDETKGPLQVRIIADGYEDWISDPLTNALAVTLDIALQRASPEHAARGIVLRPDGLPAIGVQVALLSFEHNVRLSPRLAFEGNKRWLTKSDENGAFHFTVNRLAHSVAAVGPEGFALLRASHWREPVTLRLQPFGRVEGTVDPAAREHPVEGIQLYDPAADNYEGRVSLLGSYTATPDTDFHFSFENVPPGEYSVFINSGLGIPFHHATPIAVQPGETTQVLIAQKPGVRISGRFVPPAGRTISWRKDLIVASCNAESSRSPMADVPASERPLRLLEFYSSPAGRDYVNTARVFSVRLFEDGSFVSLEPLPPGSYRFTAAFKNASATRQLVISEEQPSELSLGDIELH